MCRKDGVDALVLGSFVKAGGTFATDVKVFDVRTGKLLKSATAQGEGAQSILDGQIGQLSRDISRGVGLMARAVEESGSQISVSRVISMDAYKYYLVGQENLEKLYYEEARINMEKAVELDPEFVEVKKRFAQI